MKRMGLSMLLGICAFMASVAQEGFKITDAWEARSREISSWRRAGRKDW